MVAAAAIGAVGAIGGSYLAGESADDAASTAAGAQERAAMMGVEEQRRQFNKIQKLLRPYVRAGTGALGGQQALLGLAGPEQQREAIAALEGSPQFEALTRQGEQALLSQASATGGLRGGNLQAALAQFRPQVLSGLIEQQYARLGGLTNLGQASAAGQAAFGQQTGANIANLYGQMGAAQAGSALARGQAQQQMYGGIGSSLGTLATLYGTGAFGGGGGFGFGGGGGAPAGGGAPMMSFFGSGNMPSVV